MTADINANIIKELEIIYERMQIPTTSKDFLPILAQFSKQISNNPLLEPYIKHIAANENEKRKQPEFKKIIQQASPYATGKQALQQEKLRRDELCSAYWSLFVILRANELYDIDLHDRVRDELKTKKDMVGLANFNEEVNIFSQWLDEQNDNFQELKGDYLTHANHVLAGIKRFFLQQNAPVVTPVTNSNIPPTKFIPVTARLNADTRLILSTDDKEDLSFKPTNNNKPSNRYQLLKLLLEHPEGLLKSQIAENLGVPLKKIYEAHRGIIKKLKDEWQFDNYIFQRRKSGKLKINDAYPTEFHPK